MAGLYGITGNTGNVAVTNTTGLYRTTSSTPILNSAQQLLTLLYSNGNVDFTLTSGNNQVQAYAIVDPMGPGFYSNSNVAAYLPIYSGTLSPSAVYTDGYFWANGQPFGGSGTIYGNANVAAYLAIGNDPTITNIQGGAIAANTNIANNTSAIAATSANIGGFYIYANATYATQTALTATTNELSSFETWANLNFVNTGAAYSNSNVASYLPVYSGNLSANNVTITNKLYGNYISSSNLVVDGDQIIYGNLTVRGNTTTINSNVITTNDLNITVGNNQSTGVALNNAGIDVGNNNLATWRYNDPSTSWQSNISITPQSNAALNLGSSTLQWENAYAHYFIGDGSQLVNLPLQQGTYSNSNVAAYMPVYGGAIKTSGIVADTVGRYIGESGTPFNTVYASNMTGLGTITGTAGDVLGFDITPVSAGLYILNDKVTSYNKPFTINTGTDVTTLATDGTITATGNITAPYFLGNGSALTGITASQIPGLYGNANVAAYLPTYTGNTAAILSSSQPYLSNIGGLKSTVTVGYRGWISGATNATTISSPNGVYLNAGVASDGTVGTQAFLNTSGQFTAANIVTANGVFWTNGAAYSSGSGTPSSLVNGSYTLSLNSDGTVTIPTSGVTGTPARIQSSGSNVQINSDGGIYNFYANGVVATPYNVQLTQSGIRFSDGTQLTTASGSSYGNTQVSEYLPHATGYTDGWQMPIGGNTARPSFAANGMIRFNSDTLNPEWYNGISSRWNLFSEAYVPAPVTITARYLVVAGGGGGGETVGGGGGAGGLLQGNVTLSAGTTYTVTIGGGGAGASAGSRASGSNGSNSSIAELSLTAVGGGGGGSNNTTLTTPGSGGSGGGGGGTSASSSNPTGSGTSGQGYAGGAGMTNATSNYNSAGGGGGGAGAVGNAGSVNGNFNNNTAYGGVGGDGLSIDITGSFVYYAGGGGGATTNNTSGGAGGQGGGGSGGYGTSSGTATGVAGTANTGGGGGGGWVPNSFYPGGNGGSGVAILRLLTSQYTGTTTGSPTVTTDGSYTIIKFTSSGSYTA